MSRFRAWGVAAALAAGAGAPAAAADLPTTATDTRPWYKKMFVSAPQPVGPVARSGPVTGAPRAMSAPLSRDVVQAAVQAEADALSRRLSVCDELRRSAFDRNDDALMRQADEIERQAKAVYETRTAALGVSRTARAPLPAAAGDGFAASLDLAPEKAPDPKAAAAKLVAPAAPVPVSGTAEVIRTVKPEGDK